GPPSRGGSMPSPTPSEAAGGEECATNGVDGGANGAAAAGAEGAEANGFAPAKGFAPAAAPLANGFAPANGLAPAPCEGAAAGWAKAAGADGAGAGTAYAASAGSTTWGGMADAGSAFSRTMSVDPIWIWSPGRTLHLFTRWPLTSVPGSLPRSIKVMSAGDATSMTACMRDARS